MPFRPEQTMARIRRCDVTSGALPLLLLLLWLTSATTVQGQRSQAYFSAGSLIVIPNHTWDLRNWTQISIRTCSQEGTLLWQQSSSENYLGLRIIEGSLHFVSRFGAQMESVSLRANLSNNTWYQVNVRQELGQLRLYVSAGQSVVDSVVIANSSTRSYLLSAQLGPSDLRVGQNFTGCVYQGPGVDFNKVNVTFQNVLWNNCSQTTLGRCSQDPDDCWSSPCQNGGTCVDGNNSFTCRCATNYNGTRCQNDLRSYGCNVTNICQNNGTCRSKANGYECECSPGFTGTDCEREINECASNPCFRSTCVDLINDYWCNCTEPGYTGRQCRNEVNNLCLSSPCGQGTCYDGPGSFTCVCPPGLTGPNCSQDLDECMSSPCQNGACANLNNSYSCSCRPGFTGLNCETNIDDCATVTCPDPRSRCQDLVNNYTCVCKEGYTGTPTQCTDIDECASSPCRHGATCQNLFNNYTCQCAAGYTGLLCETDIDECASQPCQNNATCRQAVGNYNCSCPLGFTGRNCETNIDECLSNPCKHGATCTDLIYDFKCTCAPGYTNSFCSFDINECSSSPCRNNATCVDSIASYACRCLPGFTGINCETNIDECSPDPCRNGASCLDRIQDYECRCMEGWMGKNCSQQYDACSFTPCKNGAVCSTTKPNRNYTCTCLSGFTGSNCETNIDDCVGVTCLWFERCYDGINNFTCACPTGYTGPNCSVEIDECASSPCQNGASCRDGIGNYSCDCVSSHVDLSQYTQGVKVEFWTGWEGRNCELDIDECSHIPAVCLNGGRCTNSNGTYSCYCPGSTANGVLITGANCEVASSYCTVYGQPCKNGGSCRSLPNAYICTCVPGFTDKNCTTNIDECASNPCQYNGTCVDGINNYTCNCVPGITGRNCEVDIDECQSQPCRNGGKCQDQINGYKCNCTDTGFTGDNCSVNIDDCLSSPCLNNATCVDGIKSYNCSCHPGYAGDRCQSDLDECQSSPCGMYGTCLQRSNQSLYTVPPSIPGLPPVFSFANASGFICHCNPGFTGTRCETNIDECQSRPCLYNSTCVDGINSFTCNCARGYEGPTCATEIDECQRFEPCRNGGTCVDRIGDYNCLCRAFVLGKDAYGGKNCSVLLIGCRNGNDCKNGATCIPNLVNEQQNFHNYTCACRSGFTGTFCENSTSMGFANGSYVSRIVSEPLVALRFQTTLPSGVLLLYRPNPTDAVSVELLQSKIHVKLMTTSSPPDNVIQSQYEINDGSWHQIRVIHSQNITVTLEGRACISVSACTVSFAYPRQVIQGSNVSFLVGSADGTFMNQTLSKMPFTGCMEDVKLGNEGVLIPGSSSGLNNVLQQCGRRPQCEVSTCSLRGDCRDLWYSYRCDCHRPYYGNACAREFIPATFFKGEPSWVLFQATPQLKENMKTKLDLSFFVITRQSNSLIAHLSNNVSSGRRIFKIQLVNGRIGAELLRCGQSYAVGSLYSLQVGTAPFLDNGYRHQIRVQANRTKLELFVNDTRAMSVPMSEGDCAFDADFIYFGGYNPLPDSSRAKRQADGQYFQGVIQDIELNGVKVQLFNDTAYTGPSLAADTATNLTRGAVSTQEQCALNPCQNSVNCTDRYYNDYSCTCVYGYRGKNCTEPDFCVGATCPSGSTCQSLNRGYECIAVASFNGDPSTRTDFKQSFQTTRNLTSVSAQFRTRALHGVMLYASRDKYFLRLQIEQGYASLNYKVDSQFSKTLSLTNHRVDDGLWYKVTVTWEEPRPTLKLESSGVTLEVKPWDVRGAEVTLNDFVFGDGTQPILVGSMAQTRRTGYGFLGCLQQVRVGGVLLPFYPDSSFQNNSSPEKFILTATTSLTLNCVNNGCQNNKCQHQSICNETWRDYQCLCPPGYTGRYCEVEIDECLSRPCYNGGLCLDQRNGYSCRCRRGFSGAQCETAPSVCIVNPCQNGGNCSSVTSERYTCSCSRDFTGWNCTTLVNTTCSATPCKNGGTCSAVNATMESGVEEESFSCRCPGSYKGPQCEVEADACWNAPCLYGNCSTIPGSSGYTCSCETGYTGPNCSENIDYCKPNPCNGNGECVDGKLSYYCNCSTGWEGLNCSQDVDECNTTQPCQRGTCTNTQGHFVCDCTGTGYNGTTCSEDIDECDTLKPCRNSATCSNIEGDYNCSCSLGYTGKNCQSPQCSSELCSNGGTCQTNATNWFCRCPLYYEGRRCEKAGPCLNQTCDSVNTERCEQDVMLGNFTCICKQGWRGDNCTQDVDECLSSPCQNNATCKNTNGNFTCSCVPGFTGWLCNTNINECLSNPCVNGGTCEDLINAFSCKCPTNYNGTRCEEDVDECVLGLHGCKNGATCRNTNGSYECQCKSTHLGLFCEYVNPCTAATCQNGGTCNYTYNINNQTYDPRCACPGGFDGILCEKADPSIKPVDQLNIWYIIGPIIAILVVAVVIAVMAFVMVARTKRATRGTYSPSRQETSGARVELGNVLKKPPEERLI